MIDIQMVACFNTRSPILHLFLPIQCQIHNIMINKMRCPEHAEAQSINFTLIF